MDEEEKKSKLLLVGGLIIGFIVVAALAVGGTLFFLDKKPSADAEVAASSSSPKAKASNAVYYSFPDAFTVPLVSSDRRQRFMQVSLAIKTQNQNIVAVVEKHMPLLKNNLNRLFTRQDYQTLQTPEGKLQLQINAFEIVQEVMNLEQVQIDEVLITDFVMQ